MATDKSTIDYIALVGELNIWQDVGYFHPESFQDIQNTMGWSNNKVYLFFFMKEELDHHDFEVLAAFYDFEFKMDDSRREPDDSRREPDDTVFSPKYMYLMKVSLRT